MAQENDDSDLLYLDVPKFLREEKRFDFHMENYIQLFNFLMIYKGDWILTWKNYIERVRVRGLKDSDYIKLYSEDKVLASEWFDDLDTESELEGSEESDTEDIESNVSKTESLEKEEVKKEDVKSEGTNSKSIDCGDSPRQWMQCLYDRLKEISAKRQLYVFRYRSEDRNHPNSIIFITTIDFPDLSELSEEEILSEFQDKYQVNYDYDKGEFQKLKFEDFYSNIPKGWL
jgi:hypothetical protein